jgi:hypothetical protein
LRCRQMPYTRHKRLPQRSIIGPFGKHFVDRRVVDGRFTLGIVRDGQALPLHPVVLKKSADATLLKSLGFAVYSIE